MQEASISRPELMNRGQDSGSCCTGKLDHAPGSPVNRSMIEEWSNRANIACQPMAAGTTDSLLLACEVINPAQGCGGGWKPDGDRKQHNRVVDLFGCRPRLYRPPGMAVDRTLGANRRRRRQLNQVGCFLVQRALFPDCFTKIFQ